MYIINSSSDFWSTLELSDYQHLLAPTDSNCRFTRSGGESSRAHNGYRSGGSKGNGSIAHFQLGETRRQLSQPRDTWSSSKSLRPETTSQHCSQQGNDAFAHSCSRGGRTIDEEPPSCLGDGRHLSTKDDRMARCRQSELGGHWQREV